jgi:5,10-methylenetetrahydromethanopterin reductase
MAPHLERARLGPAAVSPFRIHPIDIAANTALLAGLAIGGVYIGLARGAWLSDHGIREPARPIQGIDEAIEIIQNLLAGNNAGLEGQIFKISPHVAAPYPLPEENIPIMIGTWGKRLARLAGERADEVKIGGSANPGMARYLRNFITQGELQAERDPGSVGIVIGAVTVVDEDRAAARRRARREAALYLPVVAPLDPTVVADEELLDRLSSSVTRGDFDLAEKLVSDELLDQFAFSGTPTDILDQVNALADAGVSRVEFGTPHGLDAEGGIKLLGEQVLPALP